MSNVVQDLLSFIDASPTPYHAAAETARRLDAAGWTRLEEADAWDPAPGLRGYVIRAEGSLVAFDLGDRPLAETGLRIVGAHTDSPNLRLKPLPARDGQGVRQLAIEPYGGLLATRGSIATARSQAVCVWVARSRAPYSSISSARSCGWRASRSI